MTILISGSSGFIGRAFLAEADNLRITTRRLARAQLELARHLSPNSPDLRDIFGGIKCVVHMAARAHVIDDPAENGISLYRGINRDATLAFARAAALGGVRRFVFVSSIGVNGAANRRPFQISDIPAPEEPYAISKHEAEQGLWEIARETGLAVVIVRPPLVYGPEVKGNFRRLLRLSASGLPLPLAAVDGVRSLVSIWNLCDLLIRCVEHPAAPGHTFLAGDGEDIALPDLIRKLASGMHRPCRLFSAPPALIRAGAALVGKASTFDKLTASLRVDISETRRVLDWTPPVSIAEGIERTAQWYERAVVREKI